jgi:hypothetical protein
MSTFYVLPSRPLLGQRFAEFLENAFPGLAWPREQWRDLAELLGHEVLRRNDIFVVYREDVAEGAALDEALVRDFGATAGDEVVEVSPGGRLAILTARRWRVDGEPRRVA